MKFKELKNILDTLNTDQLEGSIFVSTEVGAIEIDSIYIPEEDMINPSGDGMEPISAYASEPEILKTESVVLKKGNPILFGEVLFRHER